MNLVIVESPSKCKKIESYLGSGYKCVASFGHIYHLSSLSSINLQTFEPTYELDPKKKKLTDSLKKEIKQAKTVILATDDDNAGHFISWSICKEFNLPIGTTKRILFHEITAPAILHAICNPTVINMNLVYAEQTRQILDLLIGYNITPLLWKNISANQQNSLSAGRCQTPALKLVWSNDKDRDKDKESLETYKIHGYFSSKNIRYELNQEFTDKAEVLSFLEKSKGNNKDTQYIFQKGEPTKVFKKAPEPFTTSRLQQSASNEMHISPKECMKICQTLYEAGLITYMRTDCAKYSAEFIGDVTQYIMKNYLEEKYLNTDLSKITNMSLDSKVDADVEPDKVQAHEAIRPTNICLKELSELEEDEGKWTAKEKRMYKLIWETSLESCMSPAEYFSLKTEIQVLFKDEDKERKERKEKKEINYIYKNTSELMHFLGWQIVKNKKDAKESKEIKDYQYLLQLPQDSSIQYKKIVSVFSLKSGKSHYTEARLIQILEEKGIGRPSTYASLIDKIQERKYVVKEDIPGKEILCTNYELIGNEEIKEIVEKQIFGHEKNKLVIQPLGIMVMDYLDANIDSLFDYEYTKQMELQLDKVCSGELVWQQVCKDCLDDIQGQLSRSKQNSKEKRENKGSKGIKIDDENVFIIGKNGPVIKSKDEDGKVIFKSVKSDIDMNELKAGNYKIEDIALAATTAVSLERVIGIYLEKEVIIKKGKYGLYAVLSGGTNISLAKLGNRPLENIQFEEVCAILEEKKDRTNNQEESKNGDTLQSPSQNFVRNVNEYTSIRKGKFGDYIFYKNAKMLKPAFYKLQGFKHDYKTCELSLLESWIREKYNT